VAKRYTDALTDDLYARLSGPVQAGSADQAILLCTVDADGRPRVAMLSYHEVAARDRHSLRLALYADSRSSANLRDRGHLTLVIAGPGLACYISGRVESVEPAMRAAPENARAEVRIEQVVFDEPSADLEPGVRITSGITCSARTGDALSRAEAVRRELLEP
jgi:hypothetical protein